MKIGNQNFKEEVEFMKEHDFKDQQIIDYLQAHPGFEGDPKEMVRNDGSD